MESDLKGWTKSFRKFVKWRWFKTPNMYHLFSYLIMMANNQDGEWEGIVVKRGQLATGRNKISADTGISEQSVRTCLDRLKSTNEITIKSTNKYSIITINKYEYYQLKPEDFNQLINQVTNKQLTNNQPTTNHKQEEEEDKEEFKKENYIKENREIKLGSVGLSYNDIDFSKIPYSPIDTSFMDEKPELNKPPEGF